MRRPQNLHPATLGDMADQGLDIWAWCNGCFHHSTLETDRLNRARTVDASLRYQDHLDALRARLSCSS